MFYYKFNLHLPNFIWTGTKGCKKKHLINPQWLRNIKDRKYSFFRLDAFFSKNKYIDVKNIFDGGWHFTNIKNPDEIHHKMKNFLHHHEYEKSGIKIEDIKKLILEKKALYNYGVDQTKEKWSNNSELIKTNLNLLPKYIYNNQNKFKEWFD